MTLIENVFNQNGLIVTLFVGGLVWSLKTNDTIEARLNEQNDIREKRYIDTITNLTTNVSDKISKIEDGVEDIKQIIVPSHKKQTKI